MAKPEKIPPVLTGVAGEYFVAAELSRRGYIASISLRNTRGIDILATNQDGSRSITIQCKTNQTTARKWLLNEKSEEFVSEDHFYVFVALVNPSERPRFQIVPSSVATDRTRKATANACAGPRPISKSFLKLSPRAGPSARLKKSLFASERSPQPDLTVGMATLCGLRFTPRSCPRTATQILLVRCLIVLLPRVLHSYAKHDTVNPRHHKDL